MSAPDKRHVCAATLPESSISAAWHRAARAWAEYLFWKRQRELIVASLESPKASD